MKKKLFAALVAALSLSVACQKNTDGDDSRAFSDPANKEQACVLIPNEPLPLLLPLRNNPSDPNTAHINDPINTVISRIELTEGSRYVILFSQLETKASSPVAIWTGTYSFSDGKYTLPGVGTIEITSGSFTITPVIPGQAPVAVPAVVRPMRTTGTAAGNLSRAWKVVRTYVEVQGGKVTLGKEFNGCNLQEIAIALQKAGAHFTEADITALNGYTVHEVIISGAGTVTFIFSGVIPFYGTWSLSGATFNWQLQNSNSIFPGQISGTVSFPADKKCELTLNGSVKDDDSSYTASFVFNLDEVK